MPFKEKIEEHWLRYAVILSVFVSGITYSVLNATVINPLRDSLENQPGLQTIEIIAKREETDPLIRSAGALILKCQSFGPAMLGVLHNKNGRLVFSPPAGRADEKDSLEETAKRETKEETGFSVDIVASLGNSPEGNTNFHLFLATIDESQVVNPNLQEVVGFLWSNPNEIPENSWRFPKQRKWIIDLFDKRAQGVCTPAYNSQSHSDA